MQANLIEKHKPENNRERVSKDLSQTIIEHYAATGQIENLIGFCNCCLFKIFDEALLMSECSMCRVHFAKQKIANAHAY